GAVPRPMTSSLPLSPGSATMHAILDVPMSSPTISCCSGRLLIQTLPVGLRLGGSSTQCKTVAVSQIHVSCTGHGFGHADQCVIDESVHALVHVVLAQAQNQATFQNCTPRATRSQFQS